VSVPQSLFNLNFYAVSVVFNTVLDCHVTLIVTDIILQGNPVIQTRRFLTVYKSSQDQLYLLNCKTRFYL